MYDCHVHTKFSTDSTMSIESVIKKSNEMNLGIILTEHMDLKFPVEGEYVFNPKKYFQEYSKYRNDKFLLGIELGMRNDCIDENRELILKNNFDCVIGSIHLIDNVDLYDKNLYLNKDKQYIYTKYLNTILQCIKNNDFIDVLGHIDYICRYSPYEDTQLYYSDFSDYIDEILKELIKEEKVLEINTRRFEDNKAIESLIPIYKRFYELGGRYVTLGSDSHKMNNIGKNFNVAKELCSICKLKSVYFKNRNKEYA